MQRESRYGEVKTAQTQARQPEKQAERRADRRGGGQREPHRRSELLEEDAGRERPRGEQPGVTERNLSRVTGEQHQRDRAYRAEQHLVGEVQPERPGEKGIDTQTRCKEPEPCSPSPRVEEREVVCVVDAEVAAHSVPIRGRVLRACRRGPTDARPAWRGAIRTASRPTGADPRSR